MGKGKNGSFRVNYEITVIKILFNYAQKTYCLKAFNAYNTCISDKYLHSLKARNATKRHGETILLVQYLEKY